MKELSAVIYTLSILILSAQAQTTDTLNKVALERGKIPNSQAAIHNNYDSLCYRSDSEVKRISKKRVPKIVLSAFDNNFIYHKKEQWRLDLNAFAVDFTDENKEQVSAYYNSNGQLLEYITLKETRNLDPTLLIHINTRFANSRITEIMEVRRVNKNQTFFVVNTVEGRETSRHYLDTDGKLME